MSEPRPVIFARHDGAIAPQTEWMTETDPA